MRSASCFKQSCSHRWIPQYLATHLSSAQTSSSSTPITWTTYDSPVGHPSNLWPRSSQSAPKPSKVTSTRLGVHSSTVRATQHLTQRPCDGHSCETVAWLTVCIPKSRDGSHNARGLTGEPLQMFLVWC